MPPKKNQSKPVKKAPMPPKQKNFAQKVIGKIPYGAIGSAISPMFGIHPAIGGIAGNLSGSVIKRLTGSGKYKLGYIPKYNSILSDAVPEFGMTHTGANQIRIRHREYITDITATTAFTTQTFNINPGLTSSFPWMSQISASYTNYEVKGFCAVFKSTCGEAVSSTNGAVGSVTISFNHNASEPAFTSKQQQNEQDWCCSEKSTMSFIAPLECARSQNVLTDLSIRQAGLASNQNIQFYDYAVCQVSTQGAQASYNAGELWFTYDIILTRPRSSLLAPGYYYHLAMGGTPTTSLYFGTATKTPNTGSNFVVDLTASTITFPSYVNSGRWALVYTVTGASTVIVAPTVTNTSNCTALNTFTNNTLPTIGNGGSTSIVLHIMHFFTITGPSAVITFSSGTLPASITSGDLIITSVPIQGTQ